MMAMTYGNVYVAKVAMGANPARWSRRSSRPRPMTGPSLIIAYRHCIAHGIDMTTGYDEQKKAVACGHWPLYRYNPRLKAEGKNPLQLDTKAPTMNFEEYAYGENRYRSLKKSNPEAAAKLMKLATQDAAERVALMQQLADLKCGTCSQCDKGTCGK